MAKATKNKILPTIFLILILIISIYFISNIKNNSNEDKIPIKNNSNEDKIPIKNIQYGPFEENTLDIYFPQNAKASLPAAIYVHGGGFVAGDKDDINSGYEEEKEEFLDNNIIVISINYRFLNEATLTEILSEDIVTAVQFIKYNSEEYSIDKENIGIWGTSAGGGSSLYLGVHDDFQDLTNQNEIKRESTKVNVIGHINSQATYDPYQWNEILEVDGSPEFDAILEKLFKKSDEGVDMLSYLDESDPPIYIENLRDNTDLNEGTATINKNIVNHHPKHGIYLYTQFFKLGIDSKLVTQENQNEAGIVNFFLNYLS